MKKILLSVFVILTFVVYTFHKRFGLGEGDHQVVAPNFSATVSSPASPQPSNAPIPSPNTNNNVVVSGKYKDGKYIGNVADAYYGNIQVQAVVSGGKITDVVFLQYPNDRRTSVLINSQAMPYLKEEAVLAQSANVDIVSGATQSSLAFRESLGSALSQAQK